MALWSPEFEQNLIKAIIGLVFLIVGAQLIAVGGTIAVGQIVFFPVSIVLFVVGAILIYFSIKVLISLLRSMGVKLWD
ncbi:hypothetical protein IX51_06625 [uncultured archaeon]|nr:hypothetical protein IX51_06625 [uncultured archaeon]